MSKRYVTTGSQKCVVIINWTRVHDIELDFTGEQLKRILKNYCENIATVQV